MIITGGTGNGYAAEVTEHNMLRVEAMTLSAIAHHSEKHGHAYIWTATADWGADKNALWLRNDNTDNHLIITRIDIGAAAACQVEVWVGNGSTSGGTAVVGVNLNRSNNNVATATCMHTNTNVDAGSGMTILSTHYSSATSHQPIEMHDALILGYYDEVAVNLVTDVGSTSINILGYFHED